MNLIRQLAAVLTASVVLELPAPAAGLRVAVTAGPGLGLQGDVPRPRPGSRGRGSDGEVRTATLPADWVRRGSWRGRSGTGTGSGRGRSWNNGPSKYYHFSNISSNGDYEAGHMRGNPGHWVSRSEQRRGPAVRGHAQWGDSAEGAGGVHVWDLNHVDDSHESGEQHRHRPPPSEVYGYGYGSPSTVTVTSAGPGPNIGDPIDAGGLGPGGFPISAGSSPGPATFFPTNIGEMLAEGDEQRLDIVTMRPDFPARRSNVTAIGRRNGPHPHPCPLTQRRADPDSGEVLLTRDCDGNLLQNKRTLSALEPFQRRQPGSYGDVLEGPFLEAAASDVGAVSSDGPDARDVIIDPDVKGLPPPHITKRGLGVPGIPRVTPPAPGMDTPSGFQHSKGDDDYLDAGESQTVPRGATEIDHPLMFGDGSYYGVFTHVMPPRDPMSPGRPGKQKGKGGKPGKGTGTGTAPTSSPGLPAPAATGTNSRPNKQPANGPKKTNKERPIPVLPVKVAIPIPVNVIRGKVKPASSNNNIVILQRPKPTFGNDYGTRNEGLFWFQNILGQMFSPKPLGF